MTNSIGTDGARCVRHGRQPASEHITVDQAHAADGIGQRRIALAIGTAQRVGRHGDRPRGDAQDRAGVADGIIGVGERALADRIATYVARCGSASDERSGQRIAIDQPHAADRVGEGRVRFTVSAAERIGSEGDRPRRHAQVPPDVGDRIVRICERALLDRIVTDVARRTCRGRQKSAQRIAVHQIPLPD